jgi:1-acyl-sn-glycerol-3-phosphate acyltransferase
MTTEPSSTASATTADNTAAPTSPLGAVRPSARQRLPRARIAPQRLAAERGGAIEGLAWLRREPESQASLFYRATRLLARAILFGVLRFRIETAGQEHLPRSGGYLLIAAAHRGWMDPFVVIHALPVEPRAWFLGSGPSTFTSRWREWLIRRIGGLLPVWRGGLGIERHVNAARAVLGNGGVFAQMPEGTVSGPVGTIGPFRHGAAVIALRTGAPIVPLAMAGTEELYVGKRMASRVLAATSVERLLGDGWDGVVPAPDSREELDLARRITDALAATLKPVVETLHPMTVDPPDRPRRFRRQLTWLFLRAGPLDRD